MCRQSKLDPLPGKCIWSDKAIEKYTKNIQIIESSKSIEKFMRKDFDDSDAIVNSFNSILLDIPIGLNQLNLFKRNQILRLKLNLKENHGFQNRVLSYITL